MKKLTKAQVLLVIETLCSDDIVIKNIQKLKDAIYEVAHSASDTCTGHTDWQQKARNLYKEFKEQGLI